MRTIPFSETIRFKFAAGVAGALIAFGIVFVVGMNLTIHYYVRARPIIGNDLLEDTAPIDGKPAPGYYKFSKMNEKFKLNEEALNAIRLTEKTNLDRIRSISIISLIPYSLLSFVGGYYLAGKLLNPINKVIDATQGIEMSSLDKRIYHEGPEDEIGKLIKTFNQMLTRLEISQKAKKQFAQDASHEIKTPLAVIRTNLEVTAQDNSASSRDFRSAIAISLQSVETLNKLAEDLLLLTKDRHVESLYKVDMVKIVQNLVQDFASICKVKKVTIELQCKLKSLKIKSNEYLATRMIRNLLDNAVKYSKKNGKVTVILQKEKNNLIVKIIDQGIGIPKAEQEKIFQRFYRVNKSRSRSTGGTGLGLSIVKELVEDMGGNISVKSKEGTGSEFTLSIPIK